MSQNSFSQPSLSALKTVLLWNWDSFQDLKEASIDSASTLKAIANDGDKAFLKRNAWLEVLRKIGVKLGKTHDYISIDQKSAVKHIANIRNKVRDSLRVNTPQTACRFLLRIDDYPACAINTEKYLQVHEIFREKQIPYLLAVTPFLKRNSQDGFLTEYEIAILKKVHSEGSDIALHGFTHEKRSQHPASELLGMSTTELNQWLDKAIGLLDAHGFQPFAFIAPFNSYNPETIQSLTKRFAILCGGPESVRGLGYRIGPSFMDESLYVTSFRGAYDVDQEGLSDLNRLAEIGAGQVIPVTIHWANGAKNNFEDFKALADFLQGKIMSWKEYEINVREFNQSSEHFLKSTAGH